MVLDAGGDEECGVVTEMVGDEKVRAYMWAIRRFLNGRTTCPDQNDRMQLPNNHRRRLFVDARTKDELQTPRLCAKCRKFKCKA